MHKHLVPIQSQPIEHVPSSLCHVVDFNKVTQRRFLDLMGRDRGRTSTVLFPYWVHRVVGNTLD